MKKKLLPIVAVMFCAMFLLSNAAVAQNQTNEQKKISYNFINEYGFFIGKHVGFTSVFVNGIKIKNSDAIGIGIGYGLNSGNFQELPIFLNYRHYFNQGKKLVPLINIGIGTSLHFWDDYLHYYDPSGYYQEASDHQFGVGLYSTIASGFTVKAFSFTAGLFFRTFPPHLNSQSYKSDFSGGIEVKVGYTF